MFYRKLLLIRLVNKDPGHGGEIIYFSCYTNNFSTDSFTFDFLENGINWGFPSGHAASSVAFGLLFILLFWKKKLISFLGVLYIFAILLGISLRWHWLSDINIFWCACCTCLS